MASYSIEGPGFCRCHITIITTILIQCATDNNGGQAAVLISPKKTSWHVNPPPSSVCNPEGSLEVMGLFPTQPYREALSAPAIEVSSLLVAGLARRAASGQRAAEPRDVGRHRSRVLLSRTGTRCSWTGSAPHCWARNRSGAGWHNTRRASFLRGHGRSSQPTCASSKRQRAELVTQIYGPERLGPFREILAPERREPESS
jgi:hypothetical protein